MQAESGNMFETTRPAGRLDPPSRKGVCMAVRYLLNHIVRPSLSVEDLLLESGNLGTDGIELRNDLGSPDPLGGASPHRIREIAAALGQKIFSINALQRCDDASLQDRLRGELEPLAELALKIGVSAVVLCPVNDASDTRSEAERFRGLLSNLKAFAPVLQDNGLVGLLEPLGFRHSALRSFTTALRAIGESGAACYRCLIDSFHFAIGPERFEDLPELPAAMIGLVHLSGVETATPLSDLTDADRVTVGQEDRLESLELLAALRRNGYEGPVSLEPFSPELQTLPIERWRARIRESLSYLGMSARP
jgi:2-keto-myo-inositol isomerase